MISDVRLATKVIERMGGVEYVLAHEFSRAVHPDTREPVPSQFCVGVCVLCCRCVWQGTVPADEDSWVCPEGPADEALKTCGTCEQHLNHVSAPVRHLMVTQAIAHLQLLFNTDIFREMMRR